MTTLNELTRLAAAGAALPVEVHAVDPMIYVLFLRRGEHLDPMQDGRGTSLQYRSRHAALKALREAGLAEVDFVHRSAYGEMIGVEGTSSDTELRQTIRLQ